ncbi:hypothetical protein [Streptomyces sp. NPDC001536]|uniref:hypothetical protein n=1 Tax=Streptomyces sp. NPDC001536 TaxID=3364583 RepID=UPI0036A4DCA8
MRPFVDTSASVRSTHVALEAGWSAYSVTTPACLLTGTDTRYWWPIAGTDALLRISHRTTGRPRVTSSDRTWRTGKAHGMSVA